MGTTRLAHYKVPIFHTRLDRGPDIISILDEKSPTAFCELIFNAGAVDDEKSGTAHLLEHLTYEGPARVGMHPVAKHLLVRAVEGGARTNWWSTEYFFSGFVEDFGEMFAALTQMVLNIQIDEVALQNEKQVVIQEMREHLDQDRRMNLFAAIVTPHEPKLQFCVGGFPETLADITSDDLRVFAQTNYVRERLAVISRSSLSHKETVEMVRGSRIMEMCPGSGAIRSDAIFRPTRGRIEGAFVRHDEVVLLLPISQDELGRIVMGVACDLLDIHPGGILGQHLRYRQSLVYGAHANLKVDVEPAVEITARAVPAAFAIIEQEIHAAIRRLVTGDYSDDLLQMIQARRRKFYLTAPLNPSRYIKTVEQHWLSGRLLHRDVDAQSLIAALDKHSIAETIEPLWTPDHAAVIHFLRNS